MTQLTRADTGALFDFVRIEQTYQFANVSTRLNTRPRSVEERQKRNPPRTAYNRGKNGRNDLTDCKPILLPSRLELSRFHFSPRVISFGYLVACTDVVFFIRHDRSSVWDGRVARIFVNIFSGLLFGNNWYLTCSVPSSFCHLMF